MVVTVGHWLLRGAENVTQPTVLVLKAGHPGVLFIMCLFVLFVCGVLGLGFLPFLFLYDYLSYVVCYTNVQDCSRQSRDVPGCPSRLLSLGQHKHMSACLRHPGTTCGNPGHHSYLLIMVLNHTISLGPMSDP